MNRLITYYTDRIRIFGGRLARSCAPVNATLRIGHHRDLWVGRVFFAQLILTVIRKLRPHMASSKYLGKLVSKQQQLLARHPSFVGNAGNKKLQLLSVCVTYQCNRNCRFCYARELREEYKQHMSLADFEFFAGWAKAQGWRILRLLGGEPTVHPDFRAILELSGKYGFTLIPATNGLYSPELNPSIGRPLISSMTFSYPQDELPRHEMQLFFRNVRHAMSRGIPVTLSWVVEPEGDGWRKIIEFVKEHRTRAAVRFSTVLPGHRKSFTTEEFREKMRGLARQIIEIVRCAHENSVVISFYRPLLRCMFTAEQFGFLKSISPFMFYTRCPLCLKGGYDCDLRLNVNPDLTCYPCNALSFKGVKLPITPATTRESINEFFKPLMREVATQPLMDSCRACRYFANYLSRLEDKNQDLADKTSCQGGCFQYRT